jgi:hypothetical protein
LLIQAGLQIHRRRSTLARSAIPWFQWLRLILILPCCHPKAPGYRDIAACCHQR